MAEKSERDSDRQNLIPCSLKPIQIERRFQLTEAEKAWHRDNIYTVIFSDPNELTPDEVWQKLAWHEQFIEGQPPKDVITRKPVKRSAFGMLTRLASIPF